MSESSHSSELSIDPGYSIGELNSILRGEIAAVEAYSRALQKSSHSSVSEVLQKFGNDHVEAIHLHEFHLRELGATPARDPGLWGGLAVGVQSLANGFGEGCMLRALLRGEAFGCQWYRNLLEDFLLPQQCRQTIRNSLMPMSNGHVLKLQRLDGSRRQILNRSLPSNRNPKHQIV